MAGAIRWVQCLVGYYITVTRPHEPLPPPPHEASEAEWDGWIDREAEHDLFSERLGAITFIGEWVIRVAAQLGLPLLSSLDEGWCLEAPAQWEALARELAALEREWRRRGLHEPGADLGRWSYEDLLCPLGHFHQALQTARKTGFPLYVSP